MFVFGAGDVFITEGSGAAPDSIRIATLQETSLDINPGELKTMYGGKKYPVAAAQGKGSITGKAKQGEIQPELLALVLGGSKAAGTIECVAGESGAVPAGAGYTITVTGSATWLDDRGVLDLSNGLYMSRVATGPTAGQYSVAAGVYTFAAADANHAVRISYRKTVSGSGSTVSITNTNMGVATTYIVDLYNTTQDGKKYGVLLYAAVLPKLSLGFKNEDFAMPDLDITCLANASDKVADFYFPV